MTFEQFKIDDAYTTPAVVLTKEEIITFANQYDPQYFHISEKDAKTGPYGGLIASGFHTIGKVWAEWIRMDVLGEDCLGGLSAEHLQWKRPVYPEDALYAIITVKDTQLFSDQTRGRVSLQFLVYNQHGKEVLTFTANVLVATKKKPIPK